MPIEDFFKEQRKFCLVSQDRDWFLLVLGSWTDETEDILGAGEKQTDDEVDELLREWTTVLG
jgi:hypothetical protein